MTSGNVLRSRDGVTLVASLGLLLCGLALSPGCSNESASPSQADVSGDATASEEVAAVPGAEDCEHCEPTNPVISDPASALAKRTTSTATMADRLAAIHRTADPRSNIYLSDRRLAAMERALPAPGAAGRLRALGSIAPEAIKAGDLKKGIAWLEELQAELDKPDSRARVDERARNSLRELTALAWLRFGEVQNCLERHSADSCLIPIAGDGLHTVREGSTNAAAKYQAILDLDADNFGARWLLNLAAMTLDDYPAGVDERWRLDPATFVSDEAFPRFVDRAMKDGLAIMGRAGGSVTDDFDGDGDQDLFVSAWGLDDQLRYFENLGDDGWRDATVDAGLIGITGGLNMVHADYDGDGLRDVLVLRGAWIGEAGRHPNSLLRNLGGGRFSDVTEEAGLLTLHPTQAAVWFDVDRDGDLDLFIGNETWRETPHPCELFLNNGDGTFVERAAQAGANQIGVVKAVTAGDYDNDGWPDLYLSILNRPNVLLRNLGPSGGFEDQSDFAGVAAKHRTFPTWFFDFDNDGWLDLFVGSYQATLNDVVKSWIDEPNGGEPLILYRNQGDGTFLNVAPDLGLDHVTLPMAGNFGDIDNDGWEDIYLGTGEPDFRVVIPNLMLRNAGGTSFHDVTTSGGFGNIQKGHGISFFDSDGDGDQDIYAVLGGAYPGDTAVNMHFENPGNAKSWLTIDLVGRGRNLDAIGARVTVFATTPAGPRTIHRVAGATGSFGSSSLSLEVGLGDATAIDRVEIEWPTLDGAKSMRQTVRGLRPKTRVTIRAGIDGFEVDADARGGMVNADDNASSARNPAG